MRLPFVATIVLSGAVLLSPCSRPIAVAQAPSVQPGSSVRGSRDLNPLVLQAVKQMPEGGSYAVTSDAKSRLMQAVRIEANGLFLQPEAAKPSFCSGATYLVLLKTLELAARNGALSLEADAIAQMAVKNQRDGDGIWGRWNANGPGTARLFHELGLGKNFTDYADARPGDFMKIFWTDEIGKLERGHSVVYLGTTNAGGEESVTFWSSNKPAGYGVKTVAKKKIARVIFSRLENPQSLSRASALPKSDRFLADMLVKRFTLAEVAKQCGF